MAKLVLDFEKSDGTKMQITDDDIMSVNSLSQSASDTSTINYGSIASTGSITIQDKWNKLEDMVLNGEVPASNAKIDLVINDNTLQSHISSDSTFDDSSNELNITLTNKIGEWDNLKYAGYPYPNESRTLYQILSNVLSSLGYTQSQIETATSTQIVYTNIDNDGNKINDIGSVKDYLNKIKIEYPSIEYGKTYRQVIDEICIVAQLRCFIDDEDNLKFVSARPLVSELDTPIEIPSSVILDDITGDLFIKNKYDGIEISETAVNDNVDIETTLYTWKSNDEPFTSNTTSDSDEKTTSVSGVSIYSYVKVTATYYTGTIKLKKKSDDNLEQILSVLDGVDLNGNPRIKYNVNYTHKTGGVNVASTGEQFFIIPNYTSSYEGSGSLATYSSISTAVGSTISASVNDETNLKTIKITSDDDYYYATFKVLVGYTKINGSYSQTPYQLSGSSESFEPKSVEVSVYGNKRTITFTNSSASTDNISQAKTVATVQSSSLLQDKTTFDGKAKMSEIIKHNIRSDYAEGTRSLSLKTVCYDLYNSYGVKAVDFKNGEVLQNGNLVYLKGDNSKIYSIYSRDFIYDGSPEVALMVESNKILPYYGLYKDGVLTYSWDELLKTGKVVVDDGVLTYQDVNTTLEGDKLIIKNNVKSITDGTSDNSVFRYSSLKDVILPNSLQKIGSYVFNGSLIRKIITPNKTNSIGDYAFNNCDKATELTIGESVYKIGEGAFYNCSKIKTINYNATQASNLPSKNKAFYRVGRDDSGITVNIASNVVYIPENLFLSDETIRSNNPYITSVNFLDGSKCTAIGQLAFAGCESLTNITIPNSITVIGNGAFEGCSSLSSIVITENVINIGYLAFYGCSNLKEMTFLSKEGCYLGEDAIPSNVEKIYIPKGSYESYAERASWANYLDKLIEMDE